MMDTHDEGRKRRVFHDFDRKSIKFSPLAPPALANVAVFYRREAPTKPNHSQKRAFTVVYLEETRW